MDPYELWETIRNYSVTELEPLSVVIACEKFRVFILGYPIHVLTDHQALEDRPPQFHIR